MRTYAGPALILVFCVSQAFRDVLFGHLFQNVGFFALVFRAFALSTILFVLLGWIFARGELRSIGRHWRLVWWMNLTTALAWTCFFSGLRAIEPVVANAAHSGAGPIAALLISLPWGGWVAGLQRLSRPMRASYSGLIAAFALLWLVVLGGWTGVDAGFAMSLVGLCALLVSGTSITASLLISKRLHDLGFGSVSVTAVRYPALVLTAALLATTSGQDVVGASGDTIFVSLAGLVLIVGPTFVLQMGIARTPALTGQIIRSLGPVFVFGLQAFDSRIAWSGATLAAILAYSVAAIACNVTHGWRAQ